MFDKEIYLNNLSYKKHSDCKVYCTCHNICIHGEIIPRSSYPIKSEISNFLDFSDQYNDIQKIKNESIKLSNCSSVAVTPGGTNPSSQMEVRCLECNTNFHVCLLNKKFNKNNKFYCQKQSNINIKERSKKKSYSAEGSMGSIYADSLPSSMRLLFERQAIDCDTFGFVSEDEYSAISETKFTGLDFHVLNDYEDPDYDLMFSNESESFIDGYSDLGKYIYNETQIGCLIDA